MMTSQHPITQMMHEIVSTIHALSEYEIKNGVTVHSEELLRIQNCQFFTILHYFQYARARGF